LKRSISISLLCCFFLNIIGFHVLFFIHQAAIKNKMEKAVRLHNGNGQRELVFLLSDKKALNQLCWDGDDEFSLNGEMYDVIEKKIEHNRLIIDCLADREETALFGELSDHWKQNDNTNKIASELFQLLQTLFHNPKTEELPLGKPFRYNIYFLLTTLPFGVKRIPTPPPQIHHC
jgi:hypothetical protein